MNFDKKSLAGQSWRQRYNVPIDLRGGTVQLFVSADRPWMGNPWKMLVSVDAVLVIRAGATA